MNANYPIVEAHQCYVLLKRPGVDDEWLKVGVALPRQGEKGFYLLLGNFPLTSGQDILLLPSDVTPESSRPPER
ncbi:hypothetical protein ABIF99_000463 [Bradyrhizobium japonicum]|nr:hypothetical protein [Bradyrhizobium japonicum]MCP1865157.1 hypothetical protein [Bradyrhizobium japonicum]MCP1896070.1 hypothetical protein [Bradyrhizobium japonicum]MCW2329456.1 hypothetical protein [Bradyrhizobium japonicum]